MADLTRRSTQPELMDDQVASGQLSQAEYAHCLANLETINRLTRTHQPTLAWLDTATRFWPPGTTLSILDVACGHGDLLRAIHRWALRRGLVPALSGIDMNPESAPTAAAATPPEMAITWVTGDVFAYTPSPDPDFIVSSQFTHHLDDNQVVAFLAWMERHARRGWFIADLHRHAFAYYGFPWLARLMRWHRIVRIDGAISIARSFRRKEWLAHIAAAGVPATVQWHFAFHYCVERLRPEHPA